MCHVHTRSFIALCFDTEIRKVALRPREPSVVTYINQGDRRTRAVVPDSTASLNGTKVLRALLLVFPFQFSMLTLSLILPFNELSFVSSPFRSARQGQGRACNLMLRFLVSWINAPLSCPHSGKHPISLRLGHHTYPGNGLSHWRLSRIGWTPCSQEWYRLRVADLHVSFGVHMGFFKVWDSLRTIDLHHREQRG